jgi:hypothetical protein
VTIPEVRLLAPGTKVRWFKLDNTRFRPQPRVWTPVTLLGVTGKRAVVEYAFKRKFVDPKWISPIGS